MFKSCFCLWKTFGYRQTEQYFTQPTTNAWYPVPLYDADAPDDADPGQQDLLLWLQYTNTHRLQKSCGGKGTVRPLSQEVSAYRLGHSLKWRASEPLLWQAFIVFLGPLHQRWSSFTMQRFVLGGYLLQTKERVSLSTSKEDICNVKGEVVQTGYAPHLEGLAQILGR